MTVTLPRCLGVAGVVVLMASAPANAQSDSSRVDRRLREIAPVAEHLSYERQQRIDAQIKQAVDSEPSTRTILSVVIGAALGGTLGGFWAQGACERPDCDAWQNGAIGGAIIGGGIGFVVDWLRRPHRPIEAVVPR